MKKVVHKAESRGGANHGWLKAKHSFSFAGYHNPERNHFGVLRVLNDDLIAGGRGFGTHPHDNMEIITIPLKGDLQHKDSMGNSAIIRSGEVQVMSAGTGVQHSEFNPNPDIETQLFQIWLFPRERNVTPRYDQISIADLQKENELYQILSPNADDDGVWIHQDAWFSMADYKENTSETYTIKKEGNGVYAMIIEGNVSINDTELSKRDAIGIWDTESLSIKAEANSKILLMDIPMQLPRISN